jgi:hypothetical protein
MLYREPKVKIDEEVNEATLQFVGSGIGPPKNREYLANTTLLKRIRKCFYLIFRP